MPCRIRARGRDCAGRFAAALGLPAALCLAAALACASSPYDAYREAHPGWTPSLPEAGSAEELVAALYGPDGNPSVNVTLEGLDVYDVASRPWRKVPVRALRGRGQRDGEFAVIAQRLCRAPSARSAEQGVRVDYFLIRGPHLIAYAFTRFEAHCVPHERFHAARSEDAALELDLLEGIRRAHGRRQLEVIEMYGRGLAYVEAGRLVEAKAWLEAGERTDEALREANADSGKPTDRDRVRAEHAEVEVVHARLRRALGLRPAEDGGS
jgi:hypothetical protein